MQVVYNGVHPEIVVDEYSQEEVITAGMPVDLPDDLAVRLLEQDTWQPVDKAAKAAQKVIDAQDGSLASQLAEQEALKAAQDAEAADATDASQTTPDPATGADNAPETPATGDGTATTDDTKAAS